ncbi:HEPN domain-containing protein [Vibrio cholerae]|uniref:HEPN domain-containing protein n=1 Tax=Vibrio cholerae TaxID=666 RepID=UPI0027391018|nr:HEPN domain-containing protein [Vibrio cholerae]MDP4497654.1 HEPN domain-containing protein [Vibrio cholerae]WLP78755.1 HEPN domain-containing protein [Vibrio cholerae]
MFIEYERSEYFSQAEFLYNLSKEDNEKRELLTNLIVIDIVTNLEVYVERLLKQFLKKYNEVGMPSSKIDEKLKVEHSKKAISEIQGIINHAHKKDVVICKLKEISKLWVAEVDPVIKLEVNTKFPRGKHGEVHLSELFEKMNIIDVLSKVNVPSPSKSFLDDNKLDVAEFIGEMTSKRNIAIHEGVPLHHSVTMENLRFYIDTTDAILKQLTDIVNGELQRHNELLAS